jgi:hypothetical protein
MTHTKKDKWDLYSQYLKLQKDHFNLKIFVKGIEKVFWEDIKFKYLKA